MAYPLLTAVIALLIITTTILSCTPSAPQNLNEYRAYFNNPENGFVKEKTIGSIIYRVQRRPVTLMMLNDLEPNKKYQTAALDSIKKTYGDSHYFLLEIEYNDESVTGDILQGHVKSYQEYDEKVKELSFNLAPNLELSMGSDTISPSLTHFERGYELGRKQRFLVAFPNTQKTDVPGLTFSYYDEVFKGGQLHFKFPLNDPDKIPPIPIPTKET